MTARLQTAGLHVVEAARMPASDRRGTAKNDELDATRIARAVLGLPSTELRVPRELSTQRARVALRVLVVARVTTIACWRDLRGPCLVLADSRLGGGVTGGAGVVVQPHLLHRDPTHGRVARHVTRPVLLAIALVPLGYLSFTTGPAVVLTLLLIGFHLLQIRNCPPGRLPRRRRGVAVDPWRATLPRQGCSSRCP